MSGIAINPSPLMTRYLVQELRAFANDPLTIFDVGARGGMNQEWAVFGNQLRVICFEPDEEECKRLEAEVQDEAAPQVRYIPCALGRSTGTATLYEARQPASSGLYKTRMDYFG